MEITLNPLLENGFLSCDHHHSNNEPSQSEQFNNENNIASLILLSPTSFNIQYSKSLLDSQVGASSVNTDVPCSVQSSPQNFKLNYKKNNYAKLNLNSVNRWNKQECLLYDRFIELYQDVIIEKGMDENQRIQIKRNKSLFQMMSKFVGTRNVIQCRSHHQKFFKKALSKLGINQDNWEFQVVKKQNENAQEAKKVKVKENNCFPINQSNNNIQKYINIPEIQLASVEKPQNTGVKSYKKK